MLSIQQLKLPVSHTREDLEEKILKQLKINRENLITWKIWKQSLDARKKPELFLYIQFMFRRKMRKSPEQSSQ